MFKLIPLPPRGKGECFQVLDAVTDRAIGRIAEVPPLFGDRARWVARVTSEKEPRSTLPLATKEEAATYLYLEHLFTMPSPTPTGDAS